MGYTSKELSDLRLIDNEEIRSKIVTLNIFDNIDSIRLNEDTKKKQEFAVELYQEYLNNINDLGTDAKEQLLIYFIEHELSIKGNIWLSKEQIENANRYLSGEIITNKKGLDREIFLNTYNKISNSNIGEFRTSNNCFVGYDESNKRVVDYLPISYDEIDTSIDYLFKYFNSNINNEEMFIKPFIVHGLVGALQIFPDANLRLGRCLEHVLILDGTNKFMNESQVLPFIYCTNSYYSFLIEYKQILKKIAIDPSNDVWNEWILFNYKQLIGQIFKNEEVINKVRRKVK